MQCRRPKFNLWVGRSPGGGHGNPLQYSCLENPMDRRACQAIVHRVAKSWSQLLFFLDRLFVMEKTLTEYFKIDYSFFLLSRRKKGFFFFFFLRCSQWEPGGLPGSKAYKRVEASKHFWLLHSASSNAYLSFRKSYQYMAPVASIPGDFPDLPILPDCDRTESDTVEAT